MHCAGWERGKIEQEQKRNFQFNSQANIFEPQSSRIAQVEILSSQAVEKELESNYERHFAIPDTETLPAGENLSVQANRAMEDLPFDPECDTGKAHLSQETIDNVCVSQGIHPREINQFLGYSWDLESKVKCSRKAAEAMAGELLERNSPPSHQMFYKC